MNKFLALTTYFKCIEMHNVLLIIIKVHICKLFIIINVYNVIFPYFYNKLVTFNLKWLKHT